MADKTKEFVKRRKELAGLSSLTTSVNKNSPLSKFKKTIGVFPTVSPVNEKFKKTIGVFPTTTVNKNSPLIMSRQPRVSRDCA